MPIPQIPFSPPPPTPIFETQQISKKSQRNCNGVFTTYDHSDKAFMTDQLIIYPMCSLAFSLFSSYVLIVLVYTRILCVCAVYTVQYYLQYKYEYILRTYHTSTSICTSIFLYVASSQSKGINRVFEYINYRTTRSCKREKTQSQ